MTKRESARLKPDIEKSTRGMAERMDQADDNFIATLMEHGKISRVQAEKVFRRYKKERIVKRDLTNARWTVTHGGFLDQDVIQRAAKE